MKIKPMMTTYETSSSSLHKMYLYCRIHFEPERLRNTLIILATNPATLCTTFYQRYQSSMGWKLLNLSYLVMNHRTMSSIVTQHITLIRSPTRIDLLRRTYWTQLTITTHLPLTWTLRSMGKAWLPCLMTQWNHYPKFVNKP